MKNKIISIVGLVLLVACTSLGYFIDIQVADVIALAGAFFGATLVCVNIFRKVAKEDEKFTWKHYVVIFGTIIAGILCCIGGLSENIISSICGATVGLLAIIMGVISLKKK